MFKIFLFVSSLLFSNSSHSNDFKNGANIAEQITALLELILAPIVNFLAFLFLGGEYSILGYDLTLTIFGFPFLVLWLIIGGIFFTFKLNFVNLRLFTHAIKVVRGKYEEDSKDAPGKISHAQALFTAVSATVGLGNIAGVAIAIAIGGPGAVIWMMIAAFFGMSTKFAEVTLGHKYRKFDNDGHLLAGPFYYLEAGLIKKNMPRLGKYLAKISAYCCVLGAIGAGLMFQANQTVAIIADSFSLGSQSKLILVSMITLSVAFILIGGIARIAKITEKIVPFMAITYVLCCLVILYCNIAQIPNAVKIMFSLAFSGSAIYGGVIGAIIQGIKRSAFSNEAGLGSAPIAHAAAKTKEPVREGAVAILEPFIDTIIICFMTGIVIIVTGVYNNDSVSGVLMTKEAFATVSSWFPYLLSFVVFMFAFSTMLTYSYYGQQAWRFITKKADYKICHIVFAFFIFVGGMLKIGVVIDFADILFLSMAIPNLIGLYIMSGEIKDLTKSYILRLKNNNFK